MTGAREMHSLFFIMNKLNSNLYKSLVIKMFIARAALAYVLINSNVLYMYRNVYNNIYNNKHNLYNTAHSIYIRFYVEREVSFSMRTYKGKPIADTALVSF